MTNSSILSNLNHVNHNDVAWVVAQRTQKADDALQAEQKKNTLSGQMAFVAHVLSKGPLGFEEIDATKVKAAFNQGNSLDEKGWKQTYQIFHRHLNTRTHAQNHLSRQKRIAIISAIAIVVLTGLVVTGVLPLVAGLASITLAAGVVGVAKSQHRMAVKERDRQDIQLFTIIPQKISSRSSNTELQENHIKHLISLSQKRKWEYSALNNPTASYKAALDSFQVENGIILSFS